MKKSLIVIIVIVLLLGGLLIGSYNGMVSKREAVDTAYSNLDVTLQRRADLIPNLVNTVKGYTSHETAAIEQVTNARTKYLNSSSTDEKIEANNEISKALSNLLVVVENYPDLKASTNFTQLSDELSGTENRIAVARRDYNDAVKTYNLSIKQFFISNSMKVLINLSEFLFHGYFDVIYFAMLVGIVFYIIWITLSFVISSKVDPYFYNVISFLFRYIKIMWRLSTDCFLIIFLYMMLFFGRTFIESLTDLSTTHNMVITDDNHTKIIVLHATEGLGFLKDGEIGLIYILLIFNILFSVGYVLFRLFRRNENINL